ncbi:hypothetical protein BLX87_15580 [Bacillus sp. VT-16-64]|nr:hypothetical protein BLX87_15580 [Bacillus sp. VT-16-64]
MPQCLFQFANLGRGCPISLLGLPIFMASSVPAFEKTGPCKNRKKRDGTGVADLAALWNAFKVFFVVKKRLFSSRIERWTAFFFHHQL